MDITNKMVTLTISKNRLITIKLRLRISACLENNLNLNFLANALNASALWFGKGNR